MNIELNNGTKVSLNTNDVKEVSFPNGKLVATGAELRAIIDSITHNCLVRYDFLSKKIEKISADSYYTTSLNLWDGDTLQAWISYEGNLNYTLTKGNSYLTTNLISVKPNTYYCLSGRPEGYAGDAGVVAGRGKDSITITKPLKIDGSTPTQCFIYDRVGNRINNGYFKTDENTHYVIIALRYNNNPQNDDYFKKIMLEEIGSSFYYYEPSPYKPYENITYKKEHESPLKGKLISFNGDSFCESRYYAAPNGGSYPGLIAKATGCLVENRAVSGGLLSSNPGFEGRQVVEDIDNMSDNADIICLEGGINDWSLNIPLGSFDINDYSSTYDKNTITGAMEEIFRKSLMKWPGKPIVFVICHKIKNDYQQRTAGTFKDVHDRMIAVCNKWSIPYYDAYLISGLNGNVEIQNQRYLTGGDSHPNPDGWHPNAEGYKKYYVPQLIKLFESLVQVNN